MVYNIYPGMTLKATLIGASIIGYLILVRTLRWKRYQALHRKYGQKYEQGLLTPEDAQNIIACSGQYDMPALMNYALSFALFKTYAIPTISKILSDTKELKSAAGISKRYADTEILISTWVFCPISGNPSQLDSQAGNRVVKPSDSNVTNTDVLEDPRAHLALARVNWLHSKYPIICLFPNTDFETDETVPEKWARCYGWREFSPMEAYAAYLFWFEIGKRMGIKDIPESMEAFKQWIDVREYEARAMIPAQTNNDVATYTTEELIHIVPETVLGFRLKDYVRRLTVCALDDNVRIAMMQKQQPPYLHTIFRFTLFSFAFFQKNLCLPRSQTNPGGAIDIPLDKATAGCPVNNSDCAKESTQRPAFHRMHPKRYQANPWYMPEPTSIGGQIKNWASIRLGLYNSPPGPNLRSEGYRLEEMGPLRYEQHGHEEVLRMAEEMYGSPISSPFSR
ncbi:hypothetical protein D9757_006960 [Collybiopsis confluens]|uniref:ER-bound oxygenase mpaB/mpaB'/Rubber oxygenase catalytic domain-containing protein n=1 Tax=Collybiopsis confluens TaxID=2823264 RepID=A0A8H5M7X1_9AGAR|nr:hypothetical protein D9757_006960 [Collybiopsis confluens]